MFSWLWRESWRLTACFAGAYRNCVSSELYVKYQAVTLTYDPLSWKCVCPCLPLLTDEIVLLCFYRWGSRFNLVRKLTSHKLHGAVKKKKDTKNQWAGRCDPGPLQGGRRGDWRWKMEKLKGSEDGSWHADPEGDGEGPEGMSLSSPEWRQMRVYSWRRHLTVDEEKFSDPITVEFKYTEDRAAISQLSDDGSQPPTMKQERSWPQASPQCTGNLIFWINITPNLKLYNSPNCHWTMRT